MFRVCGKFEIETETNTLIVGCSGTFILNGITAIAEAAFFYCVGISNVSIPETVKTIGRSVFSGCESLGQIVLPASITRIEDGTFASCKYLKTIDIRGAEAEHSKQRYILKRLFYLRQ